MGNLEGKTALITGALSGIGLATARTFAKEGANLLISGRNQEKGAQVAAELNLLGTQALFLAGDVTDEQQVRTLVTLAVERFGRLDIAVNNAGTEGELGPVPEQTVSNFRATFETNVLGVLLGMKHELAAMLKQGRGSVINLSSIAGQVGVPGASVYAASKHAVEGLTKSAALEVAEKGIRVNAVAPGPVETPMLDRFMGGNTEAKKGFIGMIPAKRSGTPEEIAQTVLFLASDQSAYITGQCIAVDGGHTAR